MLDVIMAIRRNRGKFQFAGTMPHIPHSYIHRESWESRGTEMSFDDIVKFIREHGYKEKFKGTNYKYLNIDGDKYWTMGAPVGQTIILNRAKIS